ncbi:unnamed protein product [Linum tenue]|uniref:Nuclease HARBI1 n=1 Tax=Linum tenue TaxID=586396 RepID=A0AAV0RSN0_9ROSI|nr:unnamed protein product [Linum tenue]CAI0559559.1 unnamed protein product [Linum tenue]
MQLQQPKLADEASSSRRRRKPRRYIERGREGGHQQLYNDYFVENPRFPEDKFRRRFCMRRSLFLRIVEGAMNQDPYYQTNHDATGRSSLSPLQKCTAAIRMLAYDVAAYVVDEYLRIGESSTTLCVKKFVRAVNVVFGDEYLRRPNVADVERLLHVGEQRGFPGMLGSIDCMHWKWKNCPVAWRGQYARGDHKTPTIMLEVVASQDLWIWHAFFGVPGTLNDINVLDRSPVFHEVLEGKAPKVRFSVNGRNYNLGYYLTDDIYPNWATFVKSIPLPQGPKHKLFAMKQEAARKDVERAFGVLQARFAIISGPSRMWCKDIIGEIMRACIIMHNMIVEDE